MQHYLILKNLVIFAMQGTPQPVMQNNLTNFKKIKEILLISLKALLYIVGGVLLIILGLSVTLWIKSPGKAEPITDLNGEIIRGAIYIRYPRA